MLTTSNFDHPNYHVKDHGLGLQIDNHYVCGFDRGALYARIHHVCSNIDDFEKVHYNGYLSPVRD